NPGQPSRITRFALHAGYILRALHRRAFRLGAAQVLVEPRHDLDEIARPITVVELVAQDLVPGVAAGAGRGRQTDDVSRAGDSGGGTRLHRRGADLAEAPHVEDGGEALHALLEQRLDRLRRHVAASEAGTAGGDHDVNHRIGDPLFHAGANQLDIVGDDGAVGDRVTRRLDAPDKRGARLVVRQRAGIGYGEHRDLQRHELLALVYSGHVWSRQWIKRCGSLTAF